MHIPRLHKIRISSYTPDTSIFGCQIPILHCIAKRVNPTQRELADEFRVAPPTMTGILKRLEKAGFIIRKSDENDARIMRVMLSEKGLDIEKSTKSALKHIEDELLTDFTVDEKKQLLGFLKRISANLGGTTD